MLPDSMGFPRWWLLVHHGKRELHRSQDQAGVSGPVVHILMGRLLEGVVLFRVNLWNVSSEARHGPVCL